MRLPIAVALDGLSAILFLVILLVLITGGGVYEIGESLRISVRSIENPLVLLALLLVARYHVRHWGPLFGARDWLPVSALHAATRLALRTQDWARAATPAGAARAVLAAIALALLLKAWLALANPGFFSGDDVEIHEMSLGVLLRQPWPVWDLRNAIFPMVFVYPAQWLLVHAGIGEISALVVAGRVMVAVVSSLAVWLTWRIAREWWPLEQGWALVAAILVATAKLQIAFGSSELPRPVSTVFVLLGFLILQRQNAGRAALAGLALAVAASLRFSEAVFLIPALVSLALARQFRHALIVTIAMLATAAGLLGLSDLWYWGQPFHSVRAIVDYTLVQQLSSRGYEPVWWYLTHVHEWANPAVAGLAIVGWRESRDARWWVVVPVIALSMLPHKEARYLIPVTPFLCLMGAAGLRRLVLRLREDAAPQWLAAATLAALGLGMLQDVSHYRLPRTNAEVMLIRELVNSSPPPAAITAEQAWRIGGRLYLDGIALQDLDPALIDNPDYLSPRLPHDGYVLIDHRTFERGAVKEVLHAQGYEPVLTHSHSPFIVCR